MWDEVLEALSEEDPGPLKAWLHDHGIDHKALWRLPRWNTGDHVDGTATLRLGPPDSERRATEELARQLPHAARHEGGVPLLLLYLLHEVEQAWERSYHYRPMWHTLRAARALLHADPTLVRPEDEPAVCPLLLMMASLDQQIQVENALTCGHLPQVAKACRAAAADAATARMLVEPLEVTWPALTAYAREWAGAAESYYHAVGVAGEHLRRFLADGQSLAPAIEALAAAEADDEFMDHYDRSELRAHRFSLTALREAQTRDWLWIDHGKVVYLYPFALRGMPPEQVAAQVAQAAAGWRLGGAAPTDVKDRLDLDDVWDGSDYLGRRYEGALVELPPAVLRDGDGEVVGTVDVGLRMSRLGNHYVRLEAELVDASPQDVSTALFRAAPEHGYGDIRLDADGAGSHARLCDLAVRLAQDVAANLGDEVRAVTRPGTFHVLLSIHAASLTRGSRRQGGRREVRDPDALLGAVGAAVLTNSITHCVGSIAEWIQYPDRPAEGCVEIPVSGQRMLRTCNTTVLVALGAPEFSTATRETVAEFVASLDGLLAGWLSELASHHRWVGSQIPAMSALTGELSSSEWAELAGRLEREQFRLHEFATETRSVAALIESPSLVSSPVEAATLAALLAAADYPRRLAELHQRIGEVLDARLGLRIEALARRRAAQEAQAAARLERRRRARMDTMLAVIAAIGISGLGQIIQAGYDVRLTGAVWLTVLIATVATAVGIVVWRLAAHAADEAHASTSGAGDRSRRDRRRVPRPRAPATPTQPETPPDAGP